ncbi:MAG: hypothetical protein WA879_05145 [Candidatus Acidiferrales bacterium]
MPANLLRQIACVAAFLGFFILPALAQQADVTAQIQVRTRGTAKESASMKSPAGAVVWLEPLDRRVDPPPPAAGPRPKLVQKNKSFEPHLLVVPVGSTVDFPNRDPFFHNVFSLFDGKRFDLGLYEAGATNSVRFDRVGVSYLFCNIHPEMSAVVVALDTPYYAISDRSGVIHIHGVPDGRYELHVWSERSLAADLRSLTREVRISPAGDSLGIITLTANPDFTLTHKNKYGQDYVPPPATTYDHP